MADIVVDDYGATPDDGTDDTSAIDSAFSAASPGDTIVFNAGTYLWHRDDSGSLFRGSRDGEGLSFRGQGPGSTVLKLNTSEHGSADSSGISGWYRFLRWDSNYTGSITVEDMELNGDWENHSTDSTGFMLEPETGTLTVDNCRFVGAWTNGIYVENGGTIRDCDFIDTGIGYNRASGSTGHAITQASGSSLTVERCYAQDSAGNFVDCRDGSGDVTITRCYSNGSGTGFLKFNSGTYTVTVTDCYHHGRISYAESTVVGGDFYGWGLAYNVPVDSGQHGTLVVDGVHVENTSEPLFDFPRETDVELIGDGLVGDDINDFDRNTRNAAIYIDNGSVDFGSVGTGAELSVVNTPGSRDVFQVQSAAGGTVAVCNYAGTSALGTTGSITVSTANSSESAHTQANIPGATDVGSTANTGGGGTGDAEASAATGGAKRCEEGAFGYR